MKPANYLSVVENKTSQESFCQKPWGHCQIIQDSVGYKVKKIVILPHLQISLQTHQHRSEHWVVVSGVAQVQNGKKKFFVRTGESTFIPAKAPHRIKNISNSNLVIIEIQCGKILNESDITRLEDDWGRV